MSDELDVDSDTSTEGAEATDASGEDAEKSAEGEQQTSPELVELKTRNEKLFARAKKAEERAKSAEALLAKLKPKTEQRGIDVSEVEELVDLRVGGLSREEINLLRRLREGNEQLSETHKRHANLIEAHRSVLKAKETGEEQIPAPSNRSEARKKDETRFWEIKDPVARAEAHRRSGEEILKRKQGQFK